MFALLASCLSEQKAPPEKISGAWELHQVETAEGKVDALPSILSKYPACTWGRTTFTFTDQEIQVGLDVLCPTGAGDYSGCEVAASVPASWNDQLGQWTVPYPVAVRSRTNGIDEQAISGQTQCEVSLNAGTYEVERVYPKGGEWRWEMRAPGGVVYRLRLPRSDRPDFVSAISERTAAAAAPAAAPAEPAPEATP